MKVYLLLPVLFFMHSAHAQSRNVNKTQQVEQLQQLQQTVTRKIDSLHQQLADEANNIKDLRKKLDQLKKENNGQDKPDITSREQESRLSDELTATTSRYNNLQRKFEERMTALDKAVNLQKELEDKISSLVKESSQ